MINMKNMNMTKITFALALATLMSATFAYAEDFSVHLDRYAKLDDSRVLPKFTQECTDIKAIQNIDSLRFINGWRLELNNLPDSRVPSIETGWLADASDILIIAWEVAPPVKGNSTIFSHTIVLARYQKDRSLCRELLRMRFDINVNTKWSSTLLQPFFTFDAQTNRIVESLMVHTYIASDAGGPLLKRSGNNSQHEFANYQANFDVKYQIEYAVGEESLILGDVKMWYFTQKDDTLEEVGQHFFGQTWTSNMVKGANPDLADVDTTGKLAANVKIEIAATRDYFETFVRRHLLDTKLEYTSPQNE